MESCCENCVYAEQTDIDGLVFCQIDKHSKDDDMLCEKHERTLK